MADELTDRQREVLQLFVDAAVGYLPAPTLREIQAKFGWGSITAATDHVQALVRKGWLERGAKGASRSLLLTNHARLVFGLPARAAA